MRTLKVILATVAVTALLAAADETKPHSRLAKEVRHELVMLPYYGVFDNLEYIVEGNKVILGGQVTLPTLKSDAENVLKQLEGVGTVENRIEVLPLSPNDDRVRIAAYRAIYGHASLNRYAMQAVPSIHIVVKNGNITLVGAVGSQMDKQIAEIQAKSVPGAFSVNSMLRIDGGK